MPVWLGEATFKRQKSFSTYREGRWFLFLITFRNLKITDFDNSAICSTTLNEEVSATEFSMGTLCVAACRGVEGLQEQNNAGFLPEPRLPLTISPHLLQTLSTGVSYFIVDIPKLCCSKSVHQPCRNTTYKGKLPYEQFGLSGFVLKALR